MNKEIINYLSDKTVDIEKRQNIASRLDNREITENDLIPILRKKYGRKYDESYVPSNIQPQYEGSDFLSGRTKYQKDIQKTVDTRVTNIFDNLSRPLTGDLGHQGSQIVARTAGFTGDVLGGAGEIIGATVSAITPDYIEEKLTGAVKDTWNALPEGVKDAVITTINKGGKAYEELKKKSPDLAYMLKGLIETGLAVGTPAGVKFGAKGIATVGKETLDLTKKGVDLTKKGITSGAKKIGQTSLGKKGIEKLQEGEYTLPQKAKKEFDFAVNKGKLPSKKKSPSEWMDNRGLGFGDIEEIGDNLSKYSDDLYEKINNSVEKVGDIKKYKDKDGTFFRGLNEVLDATKETEMFRTSYGKEKIKELTNLKNKLVDKNGNYKGELTLGQQRTIKQAFEKSNVLNYQKDILGKSSETAKNIDSGIREQFNKNAEEFIPNIKEISKEIQVANILKEGFSEEIVKGWYKVLPFMQGMLAIGSFINPALAAGFVGATLLRSSTIRQKLVKFFGTQKSKGIDIDKEYLENMIKKIEIKKKKLDKLNKKELKNKWKEEVKRLEQLEIDAVKRGEKISELKSIGIEADKFIKEVGDLSVSETALIQTIKTREEAQSIFELIKSARKENQQITISNGKISLMLESQKRLLKPSGKKTSASIVNVKPIKLKAPKNID